MIGLLQEDVLITIIGGVITGVSAVLVYILQKKIERYSNKYSSTSILYDEITRNTGRYESYKPITNIQIIKKSPTSKIYNGLLSTGNIKYFDGDLQSDLEELYDQFEMDFDTSPDSELLKKIYTRLEKMKCYNKRYNFGFNRILCR